MAAVTGITAKTTQLAWMITLASLCLFIAFIIPEQKRNLRKGLESKAHGIAAGLQGEVVQAAITEDYSSVVEHALQVVSGDPDVEFLIITKSNGYSVIVDRAGWRIDPAIAPEWYQLPRAPSGTIGMVPVVNARLFHYASPFDYSGLPWGWVHVGLSLESYDTGVREVYVRTTLLGCVCILLSLLASSLFARRLLRPVLSLRAAVEQVARGDLGARASIDSHDEVEQLANAFNDMADAILQRDRIVESVRYAAQVFEETNDWHEVFDEVIARIGQATEVSRVFLIEHEDPGDAPISVIRREWAAEGISLYGSGWIAPSADAYELQEKMSVRQILIDRRTDLPALPLAGPDPAALSAIYAPVFTDKFFWGILAMQDCHSDREWREVEQHSLRAIADMLGACILRQRAQQAILEANNELERRVEARTLELKEQIVAKDRAHADLQKAQKQLIELSRQSGMAEVATGVLHNVGNVLNSINVSATLLREYLNTSRLAQLQALCETLAENSGSLDRFLAEDPRGRRILPYLSKLSAFLLAERGEIAQEAESLLQHINHIKEIVSMQQAYARTYGVLEKVTATELLEDARKLAEPAIIRDGIALTAEIDQVPLLLTDRHKVLQILLNLLQNAREAVRSTDPRSRMIRVHISRCKDDRVRFEVEDNGIGIAPENLARIFSHGFTTKDGGHGFGLHSGALAANQLGGSLSVASPGLGLGARFTLEIPLQTADYCLEGRTK